MPSDVQDPTPASAAEAYRLIHRSLAQSILSWATQCLPDSIDGWREMIAEADLMLEMEQRGPEPGIAPWEASHDR